MRAWRLFLVTGWLLTACAGWTTATEATEPATLPAAATTSEPGTTPGTVILVPAVVPLTIHSPEDETTVNVPEVEVVGLTVPNGIITLNDEIAVADEQGEFSAVVPLNEGPNVIEIVASDLDGNETYLELTVTYDPGS